MDDNMLEKLKAIKSEMKETRKRREAEEKKRRKAEEEAKNFETMMQAEGTKKIEN